MWPGTRIRTAEKACAEGERAFGHGDPIGAEQQFMRALDAAQPRAGKNQAAAVFAARASVGLGRISLRNDAVDAASQHFARARELAPADQAGFYWTGCMAAHRGEYDVAERYFGEALAKDGEYQGRAYVQRAYARLGQDKHLPALEDLYRAHKSQALDDRAYLITALLLLRDGQWELADMFANFVAAPPRLAAMAAAVSGFAQHQQGQISYALANYTLALVGGFPADEVLELHAVAAYRHGRFADAARSWSSLHERHPGFTRFATLAAAARFEQVRKLARAGKVDDAAMMLAGGGIGDWEQVFADLFMQEAARSILDGDNDAARKLLAQCRKLYPDDLRPPRFLALFAALDGEFDRALSLWSRLPVNNLHRRLGVAQCAIGRGDLEQALADLTGLATRCSDARIRRQAAHMAVAVRIRCGDWAALAEEVEGWTDLRAEALYRAGRHQALLGLPNTSAHRPWRALARLNAWLPHADSPEDLYVRSSEWSNRAREELGRLLAGAALDRAAASDWTKAAAWLRHSRETELPLTGLIYGLIYGLGGDRESAISMLRRVARQAPDDYRIGHVRALMLLHTLSAADQASSRDAERWAECIGTWVSVLYDKGFRAEWRVRAQARYGKPVSAKMVTAARTELCALLERRIGARSADPRSLSLLLHREIEAATASKLLDWPAGGPLRVADLGRHREFGERVLGAANIEEMRRLFSRAGLAAVRLSAGWAAEAAELALDLRCPECRRKAPGKSQPTMCRQGCRNFDIDNPAFAGRPDKYKELAATASSVAAEALLEVARTAVSAREPDAATAGDSWSRAVKFADQAGRGREVREVVEKTARGRAAALNRKDGFDAAISILTGAAGPLSGESDLHDRVNRDLARFHNERGVTAFNKDRGKADFALQELQKSLELNPHFTLARLNAGWILYALSGQRSKHANPVVTLELLRQASEQFKLGLRDKPGDPELTKGLETVTKGLETVMKDVWRILLDNR